jgi:thiosulfate reductase/polysulfide reductase chain A
MPIRYRIFNKKHPDTDITSLEFDRSGLITLEEVEEEPKPEKWVYTTSPERYWYSPVRVKVVDGRALKIVARDDVPFFDGKQDVKSYACFYKIYAPDRLKFPLRRVGERGEGRFKRISWNEALEEIADVLRKYREAGHPEYVGFLRTHPPMEYMFNHFTHHYGSPNDVHTSLTSCYVERSIAQKLTYGEDRAKMDDYLHARYALFIGHNPLNALDRIPGAARFAEAVRRGMRTVLVDPRLNEGAYIYGAEWVPIKPGTDAAFLLGIMNVIIREKLYDKEFLLEHTNAPVLIQPDKLPLKDKEGSYLVWDTAVDSVKQLDKALEPTLLGAYKVKQDSHELVCKTGFQLLAERVGEYSPAEASRISTIPAEKIEEIAIDLGTMKPQICVVVGTVSAQYSNSVQYQRAKQVLICLLGILDKPGGQYYGPYGQSGIKLNEPTKFRIPMMVHPMTTDRVDFDPTMNRFIFTPDKNYPLGITQNFLKAIMTGNPYPIKALFIIGSDVLASHNPIWREAFKKVDFIVKSHIWPDDDCDYADIILPEAAYLERNEGFAQVTVYDPDDKNRVFTFLTGIQRVVDPLFDVKCWHDYVKELAESIGFGKYYDFTLEEYWNYQLEPLGIDMDYLREYGVYYPTPLITRKIEFGKKKRWPTETGRINLYSPEMARLWHETGRDPLYDPLPIYFPITVEPKTENEFYLIQGKCPYFQCNFYRNNALLLERYLEGKLGNTRLWINANRAASLGIEDGDWVWVESEATGLKGKLRAKVTEGIHPSAVYAYFSYGRRSKLMDKLSRSREGVNVQDFIPEHYVPWTASQAHCEAVVKVYNA